LSLAPIVRHCAVLLKQKIFFLSGSWVDIVRQADTLPRGAVAMIENVRFFKGEQKNSMSFARRLANLGDVYINDAFGVDHRTNASLVAVTKFLPSFPGLLVLDEVKCLSIIRHKPRRPFIIVLGGAKLSIKLPLVERFLKIADAFVVGGGIANTFVKAQGIGIGASIVENDFLARAKMLLRTGKIIVPQDWAVASSRMAHHMKVYSGSIGSRELMLDIGPRTMRANSAYLKNAKTIFFNGPLGYSENSIFRKGTISVIKAILANRKATVVVGGGDTTPLLGSATRLSSGVNHRLFVSTGGGAMLAFLSGKKLPGIEALRK
jgi:phosphoglycerate kinase